MKRLNIWATFPALLAATTAIAATGPEIRTSDVDLFYRLYDQTAHAPSAQILQQQYIDAGSPGVREFVPNRIKSGEALAARIARDHTVYDKARTCAAALPQVKRRLRASFRKLALLYPEAKFPPVTVLVGRDNSGGTTGPSGVLIGLEVVCRSHWLQANVEDRFVHLIAHEYAHVQQPGDAEDQPSTVLRQSLVEGGAELVAELTSGEVSNVHLQEWTKGKEKEIGRAFLADADSADLSKWLYNGVGTPQNPGDLGYWVGYHIAKRYYDRASDKRGALRDIIKLEDPKELLAKSGWTPGL